jgi:hypothetical protein
MEAPAEARPAAPFAEEASLEGAASFAEPVLPAARPTPPRQAVPGMYLSDEDELSDEESEEIDEDETPEERSSGELDIF